MRTRKWIIPLLNLAILISIVSFVGFIAKNNYAQAICSCPRGCTILFEGECICSCPEPTPTTPEPTTPEPTTPEPTTPEPTTPEPTTPEPTTPPPCVSTGCGTYNCGVDNCGNSCGDCDAGDRCSGGICETQYSRCVNGSCADAWMTKSKSANDGCVNNQCIAIQHCTWESCDVGTHTCSMHNEKDILASETCPKSCGENSCAAGNTCPMGYCRALNGIFHCSATSVAKNPDGSCPTSYCTDGTNCTVESPEPPESSNACSVTATATPNPIPTGQNQTTISATSLSHTSLSKCKVDTYTLSHTFTQTDSSHTYTVSCTGDAGYNNCSSEITVTKETTEPSCTVTATANPNPIPQGQNQTTISATSLSHTSLSKCKVDTYSLPHTFTQTDSSHTYTVSCTGDAGYNNCSDDIAITKGSTAFSVQLTANGQTDNIYVKPNTDVKLVATPSNGKPPYTRYQWTIKDKSVWHDTCSLTNPSDFGHYETCFKRHGGMMQLFNNIFSVMTKFIEPVLAAFPNDNTIYYQWSQTDTYKIYVIVTDSANKTATSNTITITVSNISTHLECNSAGQCVSVPGAGVNLCNTDADCPPPPPPPPPPPTCTISEFTINEKCNTGGNCSQQQTPLIVWVNASLTGYFSVNDSCKTCTVSSDDTWGSPPQSYPISTLKSSYPESFKITTAGTYSYTLECVGADPEDIVTDTLSLQTVKAMNLPWWREIIPNLLPFLRGMIR